MEKQKGRPVFNPADFRAYLADRRGVPERVISVPRDIIFTYDAGIFHAAVTKTAASPVNWYTYHDRMYQGVQGSIEVGIVHAMVGAPAAAMNLEELVAYGAKRIFEVGLSGAIDRRLKPGDVVVLDGALSDEGTSKHYFRSGTRFRSSSALTRKLEISLEEMRLGHFRGDAWTVDAPYRETAEKIARFRKMGARVVNMESSAVFAVARYRGVAAASVQIVSDMVSEEEEWEPAFHIEVVDKRRLETLNCVLHAIS